MVTHDSLTEREREILVFLADNLSDREIASRLHLATKTIKWYNSQLYSKLGVSNRREAVQKAQVLGLLDSQTRHNLPAQTTPFIGRQQELTDLARLIANPDTRLVTILAPGGMGKTRLGLAAAERQLRYFADGVFFVPLAPLSSPDDIVTAIAEQVGFSFYGNVSPQQQLLDYLRDRMMLLVLDNFEHLLDGVSLVTGILQAAPGVTVLATSREKLNLTGETVFTLMGLDFSGWETPEEALEYDAIQLFMQSAHRVRPDFALQTDGIDALARICRLTEGMPLGIVLAAGWVDVLTLEQIADEIQQGIDILETEIRDVPERHRSIRATFERTWKQMTTDERAIFGKLSVFRGGFTAEAAQAVAGASVRQLRKLVDKALVQVSLGGRYDLHELLRQFAAEKLALTGETRHTARMNLDYFLALAEEAETHNFGRQQILWFDQLEADIENIRSSLAFSIEADEALKGLRLAATLATFWTVRAHFFEGRDWLERLLVVNQDAPAKDRAYALTGLSRLIGTMDDGQTARRRGEEALALARSVNDPWLVAWSLSNLGAFTNLAFDPDRAAEALEESLGLFRTLDDSHGLNNILRRRAYIALRQEDYAYARTLLEEALQHASHTGHVAGIAETHGLLAFLVWKEGADPHQIRAHYEASIYHFERGGGKRAAVHVYRGLAFFELLVGNDVRAEKLFKQVLSIAMDTGSLKFRTVDDSLAGLSKLAARQGKYQRAAKLLAATETAAKQSSLGLGPSVFENYDSHVASLRQQLGDAAFAEAWAEGKTMTREQAIAFALESDKPSTRPAPITD